MPTFRPLLFTLVLVSLANYGLHYLHEHCLGVLHGSEVHNVHVVGWYCSSNSSSPMPGAPEGGECQPGFYCPEGSYAPVPCDAGSYCETAGLSTPTALCSAGKSLNLLFGGGMGVGGGGGGSKAGGKGWQNTQMVD